jgi:hypothetical protein
MILYAIDDIRPNPGYDERSERHRTALDTVPRSRFTSLNIGHAS